MSFKYDLIDIVGKTQLNNKRNNWEKTVFAVFIKKIVFVIAKDWKFQK